MLDTAQTATRKGIVRGLATLCRVLDDIPSVGRSYAWEEPSTEPDGGPPSDDMVITVGGFCLHPRGGWGSRFTTLRFLSADLDRRWGTRVWPTLDRAMPAVGTPVQKSWASS